MNSGFNTKSRTENAIKTSIIGTGCRILNLGMGFLYRTLFLYILSTAYLGINGLFSSILQVLSFAELGISVAINYRLYEPIHNNDVDQVGKLMLFYRNVYLIVSVIVLGVGLCILPFLKFFIKDISAVPSDVNLYLVFALLLLQSASSYVCVTPQVLLGADQKQYIVSIFQSLVALADYIFQILILILTRNYTLTLGVGIFLNILFNFGFGIWIKNRYKSVYRQKQSITKKERRLIFDDTKAMMCHKLAGMVLTSTDNIVLAKFVGIIANGLYANYFLILNSIQGLLLQLLTSFTSSIGNAHVSQGTEEKYTTFKRLLFLNMWIAGMCSVCIFLLIDDFIAIWIGADKVLGEFTTIVVCIQFYVETIRMIVTSYVSASGLFRLDKMRAIIEASMNIVVSVVLVKWIGLPGVFIGTIISHLCTAAWREPYILYKNEFKRSTKEYWLFFFRFTLLSLLAAVILTYGKIYFAYSCGSLWNWIAEAIVYVFAYNLFALFLFHNSEELNFYLVWIKRKILKR